MKRKSFRALKVMIFLFFVLGSTQVFSQNPFSGVTDDVDDETVAASINLFVYAGLILGSLLGINKLKKNNR